jgi:hypothetical protein
MEDLFDPATHQQLRARIESLTAASPRQWGTMSVAQMLAHCSAGLQTATGELRPPRMFIGYLLGPLVKPMALKQGAPMKRNSPTAPCLIVHNEPDLEAERGTLLAMLDRGFAAGPQGCTDHPHAFFGKLTPDEWSALMVKHLDHHLRQFSA